MIKEKWINLYELADELYELKPWDYSYDDKLLCYTDIRYNIISYASAMGKNGKLKGLFIFNENEINNYLFMIKNKISVYQLLNYQEGYFISYVNKKELKADEKIIPSKYNIAFNDIAICFHKYKKGYFPMQLNENDLDILLKLLPQYLYLLRHLNNNTLSFSNDNNKMITRFYDESLKGYKNTEIELILPEQYYEKFKIEDENIKRLYNMKKSQIEVEVEFTNYLPISSGDSYENDTYKIPRYFIVSDRINKKVLAFDIEADSNNFKDNEYYKNSINKLIDLFERIGIPRKIIVRDNYIKNIITDLNLITELELNPSLEVSDRYFEMFFLSQKNNLKNNN